MGVAKKCTNEDMNVGKHKACCTVRKPRELLWQISYLPALLQSSTFREYYQEMQLQLGAPQYRVTSEDKETQHKCRSLARCGCGGGQSTFDSIKDSISPKYKKTFILFYRLRTELIWSLLSRINNNSLSRSEDMTSLHSAVSSGSRRCTEIQSKTLLMKE